MTRNNASEGAAWGEWLNRQFGAHPGLTQRDFAEAIDTQESNVSKWRKGRHPANVGMTLRAAKFFRRPMLEALRAAEHNELADAVEEFMRAEHGDQRPDGLPDDDDGIRIILDRKDRTTEQLAVAVNLYRERKARLVAEMLRILDAMDEPENHSGVA